MTTVLAVPKFRYAELADWGGDGDFALRFAASPKTLRDVNVSAPERSTGATIASLSANASPIEQRLYDALADAKIYTSQVAMRMDREWRSKLFRQLDSLLDPEEWHEGDEPLRKASFATFLKLMFLFRPDRRPGLGISASGNLIGAWTDGDNRLTIECQPADQVKWVLSRRVDGEFERAAGLADVLRLVEILAPYQPEQWFGNGQERQAA